MERRKPDNEIPIGVSSCLLGDNVRYDGGNKRDRYLVERLGKWFRWIPVCPEVEYGLPVPRETMRLEGDPSKPRLVTVRTRVDHTEAMKTWAERRLDELEGEDICGYIFKSGSPSSGMRAVRVFNEEGRVVGKGVGIFAAAFMKRFPLIPVEEELGLADPRLRESFIERVSVFSRWKEMERGGGGIGDLLSFHEEHKMLVQSRGTGHLDEMKRILSDAGKRRIEELREEYFLLLMDALLLPAACRENGKVPRYMEGCLER